MDYLSDLYKYVKNNDFAGADPFDCMNSALLRAVPSRALKILFTQIFKASPVDLRKIFKISGGFNPKGGALFIMGLINLFRKTENPSYIKDIEHIGRKILKETISTEEGSAFGYNFDWEARAFSAPRGTPNMVVTVFVARALMEYYFLSGKEVFQLLGSIKDFVVREMVAFESNEELCFRYVPERDTCIHNVNLLAAAFLAEYQKLLPSRDEGLIQMVRKAVRFSLKDINYDFSWSYGTSEFHRWVDNFHTAYNLESLFRIGDVIPEVIPRDIVKGVIGYYLSDLFLPDGTPKYHNNKLYPIDVHTLAVVKIIMRLLRLEAEQYDADVERVRNIISRNNDLIDDFWSGKGYFYYRKNRWVWNKISYMRWAQAWMFYALSVDNEG